MLQLDDSRDAGYDGMLAVPGLCRQRKAVLFDLDGTLLNSFSAVLNTMKEAFSRNGFVPPDGFNYASIWGKRESEVLLDIGVPGETIPQILQDWTLLEEEHGHKISCFPGVPELLVFLKSKGCKVGIVTGRSLAKTRAVPAAQALSEQLDVYITPDDTGKGKPDPEPVVYALNKLGISPDQAVFIGDSVVDITAASLAGVESVLVTWGGARDTAGFGYQPDHIVNSVEELKKLLTGPTETPLFSQ